MILRRMNDKPRLAVVIPAYEEAGRIAACLASLDPFFEAGDPVVVVDAGSRDETRDIVVNFGARVLRADGAARGLAVSKGFAAIQDQATCVVIIHADMIVPTGARRRIIEAIESEPLAAGGALGHRIDDPRRRFRLPMPRVARAQRSAMPGAARHAGRSPRVRFSADRIPLRCIRTASPAAPAHPFAAGPRRPGDGPPFSFTASD